MRTNRLRVLLTVAVILTGCAQSQMGTETGNPPVISDLHLAISEAGENKVRVTGEAGAVKPGGGEVAVRNLTRDGEAVVAEVTEDGGFSVTLDGTLDDTYEVVATNAEGDSAPQTLGPSKSAPDTSWKKLHLCRDTDPQDALDVSNVRLEGDTLHLSVAHGGGCASHEYGLCYGEQWAESFPIQVGLTVLHDANGDACEAIENADLSFDLSPFQAAYERAYLSDTGAASFSLADCKDDAGCGVVYEWQGLGSVPEEWVQKQTDCGFSFRGPEDLVPVEVQGVDSCVVQFESEQCSLHGDSGSFSDNFDSLLEERDHEQFSVDLEGREAQVHMAELAAEEGEDPRFVLGIYAPDPDLTSALSLYAECSTREARDELRPVAGSLTFE